MRESPKPVQLARASTCARRDFSGRTSRRLKTTKVTVGKEAAAPCQARRASPLEVQPSAEAEHKSLDLATSTRVHLCLNACSCNCLKETSTSSVQNWSTKDCKGRRSWSCNNCRYVYARGKEEVKEIKSRREAHWRGTGSSERPALFHIEPEPSAEYELARCNVPTRAKLSPSAFCKCFSFSRT